MEIETEIALEKIILEAANGDTVALASLLEDATAARLIERVSRWAERKYKHDRADISQALALKIWTRIHTLRDPRKLHVWLSAVASRYCLDEIRRQESRVESGASEKNANAKKKPAGPLRVGTAKDWRGTSNESKAPERRSLQQALLLTPEEQLSEKEVLRRLRRITKSFPAGTAEIVDRWARGESPKEIATGTGKPVATIYRTLTSYRKAIIDHLTREPSLEQKSTELGLPPGARRDTSKSFIDLRRSRNDIFALSGKTIRFSTEQILSAMAQLDAAELEKLVPRAIALGAAQRAPHLKTEESKLLARANEALPSDLKSRLSKLQRKRDTSSLTESEYEELTALTDRLELLHAERLEALADLAKLRGLTLTALMDQLDIRFPANA